jgi:hypothetical protein
VVTRAAVVTNADDSLDHHMPFIALRDGQALVLDGETRTIVG